jgi:DNA polymerase-3 subunit gamma/tau
MSYQVLARKWRPRSFEDMVGQESIVRMLANALDKKRIHHAYLFTGTRGVGKTTIARILSKCLNCETGVTPTPCGKCHACLAIDSGQFLDLYEVDAASRTKVEDTRELLDNVLYPPTQGRYKIYLIDEVHMLSNHSFNALLKTLEEPPEHVKFLLATTDPKRLPITILSRCLQFHLKRMTPETISKHLQQICQSENIENENAALEKLAKAADGSMRDALSLLDQAIAYGHGQVNKTEVYSMLGSMAEDDLLPLIHTLAAKNGSEMLAAINRLAESSPDFGQLLEEVIGIFHKLAIAQIVPDTLANHVALQPLVTQFTAEDIQLYYQMALLGRRDLAITPSPQQGFEMTLLRMLAFKPAAPVEPNLRSPDERFSHPGNPGHSKSPAATVLNSSEWRDMLPKLELSGMSYALAANCTLDKMDGDKIILALSQSHQPMLNPKLKERIAEALGRHLKRTISLDIIVTSVEIVTPMKQERREQDSRLADAKQTILDDPQVKKLLDMYDASVEVTLA